MRTNKYERGKKERVYIKNPVLIDHIECMINTDENIYFDIVIFEKLKNIIDNYKLDNKINYNDFQELIKYYTFNTNDNKYEYGKLYNLYKNKDPLNKKLIKELYDEIYNKDKRGIVHKLTSLLFNSY